MTDPVGTHHVGGVLQDSPSVCGSPHDADDNISHEGNGEGGHCMVLSDRAPTVQRVLSEIRASDIVKTMMKHSPVFSKANPDSLFFPEMWEEINSMLIDAISACAVTVEKQAKKAALKYIKECIKVDMHAARMVDHKTFSSLNLKDAAVRRHVSLLL